MAFQILDLTPYYGIVRVAGPDALSFLQGQLTCDVREVNDHSLQLAGFCNPQGRLRALFKIFKKQETFYLELPKTLLPPILIQLKKYALFSKVVIEEASDIQIFGWQEEQTLSDLKPLPSYFQDIDSTQISVLKAPGHLPRYHLIGPHLEMTALWKKFSPLSRPCDFNEWILWDIRQGIPEVWLETTEQFFPHHLQLVSLGGVSFTKGCYCGQEIIARMHYRGTIKRRIVFGILIHRREDNKNLPAGAEIFLEDQNEAMKIVTSVPTPASRQTEILVEISNRLLPEQNILQEFKLPVISEDTVEDLVIKPLHTPSVPVLADY